MRCLVVLFALLAGCELGRTVAPSIEIVESGIAGWCEPARLSGTYVQITSVKLRSAIDGATYALDPKAFGDGTLDIGGTIRLTDDKIRGKYFIDMEQNGGSVFGLYTVLGGKVTTEPQAVEVSHAGGALPVESFTSLDTDYDKGPGEAALKVDWSVTGTYDEADVVLVSYQGPGLDRQVTVVRDSRQFGQFEHYPCTSGYYALRFKSHCLEGRPWVARGAAESVKVLDPRIVSATRQISMSGPESVLVVTGQNFHTVKCGPNRVWLHTPEQPFAPVYDLMAKGGVQMLAGDRAEIHVRRRDIPPGVYRLHLETDQAAVEHSSVVVTR